MMIKLKDLFELISLNVRKVEIYEWSTEEQDEQKLMGFDWFDAEDAMNILHSSLLNAEIFYIDIEENGAFKICIKERA